jgi:hypothetical protein
MAPRKNEPSFEGEGKKPLHLIAAGLWFRGDCHDNKWIWGNSYLAS